MGPFNPYSGPSHSLAVSSRYYYMTTYNLPQQPSAEGNLTAAMLQDFLRKRKYQTMFNGSAPPPPRRTMDGWMHFQGNFHPNLSLSIHK
ncbi:hypothetical protein GDO78_004062 [Eleutherodactylus coqui]|uniref:Uncharacterized protein n=1 Tax=Eleutherodactylus coqui TaxID=57060 RepID=A0A8J6ERL3_ELECQ|nr:hypothetical protein GDO78_004062 [Eleutherodactylus coqui]